MGHPFYHVVDNFISAMSIPWASRRPAESAQGGDLERPEGPPVALHDIDTGEIEAEKAPVPAGPKSMISAVGSTA